VAGVTRCRAAAAAAAAPAAAAAGERYTELL